MNKLVYIKIAFKRVTNTSTIPAKLIGKFIKSKYYHTELIINDLWISSNTKEGVTIKERFETNEEWDYYEFPVMEILEKDYETILSYIRKQDDKSYDYLGIVLSQFIPFSIHNRQKYFCSEIVTRVLQLFLIEEVLDLVPNNTSPKDLALIYNMEN